MIVNKASEVTLPYTAERDFGKIPETQRYFGAFYVQLWIWEAQLNHSHLEAWPSDLANSSQQPRNLEHSISQSSVLTTRP